MARGFSGSGQYLGFAGANVTAAPLTMACWFNLSVLAADCMLSIGASGASNYFFLATNASGTAKCGCSPGGNAVTTATVGVNAWHHCAGVFASATLRTVYLDGGNSATNTTSGTPTGLNQIGIGQQWTTAHFLLWNGLLAECAIWNAALSAGEVAALAGGRLPRHVRPQSLQGYWPLWGLLANEPDLSGQGQTMTVTGATPGNHAPVTTFTRKARSVSLLTAGQTPFTVRSTNVVRPALSPAIFE